MTEYKYAGFMSYSHADEAVAARLHHALETFRIPRDLSLDKDKNLHPIFRDTTELTAHHSLPEKIREAVNRSQFLIVLCSSAAKLSHWVNEEIRLFRSLHGEDSILCVLIEGTPETSFPPSLIEGGREPLAANLGTSRDSFRLGVTQLAASMLGVGLDELIQRDNKRRRNRLRLLSGASLAFAVVMGGMAWTAIDARDAAEVSRTEAEKMVEFMLTDLKQDLEPGGKLDILDDVGKRVSDYYQAIPLSDMDDDRLSRQARARHLLGQVALDQGKVEKAKSEIDAAYKATKEVMRRRPENTDAVFAHAQSAYWMGELAQISNDRDTTLKYWMEYNDLGKTLHAVDPNNFIWIMEMAFGQNNLGAAYGKSDESGLALEHYEAALLFFSKAAAINPESKAVKLESANTLALKATELSKHGKYELALSVRSKEISLLKELAQGGLHTNADYRLFLTYLNFWEIKNKMQGNCNIEEPVRLLEESKFFLEKDPSNNLWKSNYLSYWRDLLSLCKDDFDQNELEKRIGELLLFIEFSGVKNSPHKAELVAILNSND